MTETELEMGMLREFYLSEQKERPQIAVYSASILSNVDGSSCPPLGVEVPQAE